MVEMVLNHDWSKEDDIKAYCCYVLKISDKIILQKVAQDLGCGLESLKARIRNYEFLHTGKGFCKCSLKSCQIFKYFEENKIEKRNILRRFRRKYLQKLADEIL